MSLFFAIFLLFLLVIIELVIIKYAMHGDIHWAEVVNLGKMPDMKKWRKDFTRHVSHKFLCMKERHNFQNMRRYGSYDECGYRLNFDIALFKRWLKMAVLHELDGNVEVKRVKLYASTDLQLPSHDVFIYFYGRFQIEFLYRDAKGHTGLEYCQGRNDVRMGFHHNLSLTGGSVAKATYWYGLGEGQREPFSIEDIKAQLFNGLMLGRIFCVFGKDADPRKNQPAIVHIRNFGVKAAA